MLEYSKASRKIFFDLNPKHKDALENYFGKLQKQNIEYKIFTRHSIETPIMSANQNSIYSLPLIKKELNDLLKK